MWGLNWSLYSLYVRRWKIGCKAGCWWFLMPLFNYSSESETYTPSGFYTLVQGHNSKEMIHWGHIWSSVKAWSWCSQQELQPPCGLWVWATRLTAVELVRVMLTCSIWRPGASLGRLLSQFLLLCAKVGKNGELVILYWSLKEILISVLAAVPTWRLHVVSCAAALLQLVGIQLLAEGLHTV